MKFYLSLIVNPRKRINKKVTKNYMILVNSDNDCVKKVF